MPVEFKCTCGTTVQLLDKFAGRNVKCPICKKIMSISQTKQKPWWENHQESIQKIMSIPQAQPEQVDTEGYRTEKAKEKPEGFETKESSEDLQGPEKIEKFIGERSPNLKRKRLWTRRVKVSLLGLIIVLFGLFLVFFIMRPEGQKVEQTGGMGEIRKMISIQKEPSASEIQEKSVKEILQFEKNLTITPATVKLEREGTTIESSSREAFEPEKKSFFFSLDKKVAEWERIEKKKDKVAKTKEQIELTMESPVVGRTYTVNVGSFREKARADRYVGKLRKEGLKAFEWEIELPRKGRWHRVSIGNFSTLKQAQLFAKDLEEKGFKTFVAKLPTAPKQANLLFPNRI